MQVWERTVEGRLHRVEAEGTARRHVRWYVDGELVAEKRSAEERATLEPDDHPGLGAVSVRFTTLGAPRRATLHGDQVGALTGVGGTDLDPEPGSAAAKHEEQLLAHPHRYAATRVGIAVAIIAVPVLLGLLSRFLPDVDVPLPSIPWPDLPSIPWPDLPDIPWPDLPVPRLDIAWPGWVRQVADALGFVWPVLLALFLARNEVQRRRKRAAEVEERRTAGPDEDPAEDLDEDPDEDR